jgi:hypothetical protein
MAVLALPLLGCPGATNQDTQVPARYVTPVAVCRKKLAPAGSPQRARVAVRDLDPEEWVGVLVPTYDDERGIDPTVLDCTGNYVFANESLRGGASARGWPRPLDPDDVTVNAGPNGMRIVWLKALKFENGDDGGPLVLGRAFGDAAEIYGVGSFRGPADTRFSTARVGNESIVVGETKDCSPEGDACRKRAHFFLPRRGRLIEGAVVDTERTAIVPSTTERGLFAEYKLTTDVTYQRDGILLLEQVQVRITKTEVPTLDSDRELRTVEFSRFLRMERDALFSTNEPLWERVVGRD